MQVLAADWHAAPDGAATGQGSKDAPWDLESALGGRQKIAPGDTLWLRQGMYKYPPKVGGMGYAVKLAGRPGAPIHVRAEPGRRVTLDGGLNVQEPSTQVWMWDLEILLSEPRPDGPIPPDPSYKNVNRPWGGLNVYSGEGCKFINLILHDNSQGVSWWKGSKDSELYGCLIYDNVWAGTDRGHGHAIYTQNQDGIKAITDCLMTGGYGYTLHAYGSSRAFVDNYQVAGNIAYNAGTFLIGGGKPSHGIRVFTNFLYGLSLQVGYSAPTNEDCEVRGNVVVNGGLSINKFGRVVKEDNLVMPNKNAPRPPGARVVLRPNQYAPRRAHVALFNWDKKPVVLADLAPFLKPGDSYRLLNPCDFFGPPVLRGAATTQPVAIPVTGEFAAFILLKD